MAEEFYHYNKQTKTKEIILFLKIPQTVQNDQPTTLLNAKMKRKNKQTVVKRKKQYVCNLWIRHQCALFHLIKMNALQYPLGHQNDYK